MKAIPLLLCAAALLHCAIAQDEKEPNAEAPPIPQSPKARLARDVEAENLKWAQRALVAPFRAQLKGEAWNAAASAFVGHALEYWADLNTASRRIGDLPAEGQKAIAAGCKDPLVLYFFGVVKLAETGEWRAGLSEMEEALKLAEAGRDRPRALAHFIARNLAVRAEQSGKSVKDLAGKAADWITAEWKDGSYQAGHESLFVHHELGRWKHIFPENFAKTKAAYEGVPLPEWARATLVAALNDKQEAVWIKKHPATKRPPEIVKFATDAYDGFAKAWKLNPAEPWAAAEASRYWHGKEKAAREPDRREWFDRAVTAQFDLEAAYRYQIRAIAGGSPYSAKLFAFGRACLETRRFDTIVPSQLHAAAAYIGERRNDPREYFEDPEVTKPLVALCLSKLREDSPLVWREWWASWLAIYAWLGGEPLHAERAIAELKGGLVPEAATLLRRMQLDETAMRGEIAIAKAGETERLTALRRRLDSGERDTAAATIGVLEQAAGASAAGLLRALRMRVDFETEFAKGEWVRLKIPDHLDGWTDVTGKWDARNGEILLTGNDAEAVLLAPGRIGKQFEIRGEVDIQCGDNCCHSFGVLCGFRRLNFAVALSTDQREKSTQKARVWGAVGRTIPGAPEPASSLQPSNKFYCRVDGQFLTFELNGTKHFDEYQFVYTEFPPAGRFGFVVMKACAKNSWKIRNVEVRKLPAQ